MERLTKKREADAQRKAYECRIKQGHPRNIQEERFLKLAAYEDTGLTPEEIAIVKNIVGRIATADYPHNFQRERSDIAAYMHWITSVIKDAKEWWSGIVTRDKEGDRM